MQIFETILVLLVGATVLSAVARRVGIPYPTLLAVGGALLALVPNAPRLDLPPDLIMALFVAPVLLDAAYDASLRDLRAAWVAVASLVLVAVGLTTVAVAFVGRLLFPEMPWPVAIAMGALVAPPDAVAAIAVLKQVNPPHRVRMVLEGESLLNDSTALLLYKLAVGAFVAGTFSVGGAIPTFVVVVVGSVLVGWMLGRVLGRLIGLLSDAPSSVIFQFVTTFAVWLLAEHFGLSGVVTIVVMAVTVAQESASRTPAHLRVPTFAIWESATVVLNVLALTVIGLQIRPILDAVGEQSRTYVLGAIGILAVVVVVRLVWVLTHYALLKLRDRVFGQARAGDVLTAPTLKGAVVVGWSGMRGIVTLAAALALPEGFPYRDFILLTAFVVVLGTLVIQGLTLRPLLRLLRFPPDDMIGRELTRARESALRAGLAALDGEHTLAAERVRTDYLHALALAQEGADPRSTADNALRRKVIVAARDALDELRDAGTIGDDAYRRVQLELDWLELSASPAQE